MARPKGSRTNPHRPILPFKQTEVERGIRAAHNQGLQVTRIDIEPRSGKISLIASKPEEATQES